MSTKAILSVRAGIALLVLAGVAEAAPPDAVVSVCGHGMWELRTGDEFENQQPYIESTMIDAWLDANGQAHGTIVWMDVLNGLYGTQGSGVSGYTWQVEVDTIVRISPTEVFVAGVVTHSPLESDIGTNTGFYVADGQTPGSDRIHPDFGWYWLYPPDLAIYWYQFYAMPVVAGNFTIR